MERAGVATVGGEEVRAGGGEMRVGVVARWRGGGDEIGERFIWTGGEEGEDGRRGWCVALRGEVVVGRGGVELGGAGEEEGEEVTGRGDFSEGGFGEQSGDEKLPPAKR